MNEIKLTPEAIEAIRKSKALRLKLQGAIGITHNTMVKCLDDNDARLTQLDSVNIITEDLKCNLTDIISGPISKQLLK